MQNNFFVSVIIPVYNSEKYIARCLRSLKYQSLDRRLFEIIVIDDFSKDNSLKEIIKYADINLKKLGYEVGISDHTKPKDSHNVLLYAYAKGARIIEKYFTYNKSKKGNDHYHSFDWRDLKKFKKNITDLNYILGRSLKTFIKSELPSRHHARRSLFYIKNLSKHSKLSKRDLISLRPAIGIPPKNYNQIIGKRLNYNVEEGQIVKMKDFIRN